MSRDTLIAIIEEQERLALGGGQLQQDRIDALDAYQGRPYGDEQEGRSQIVMRDVADTVEWIKPSLMKVFASGDEVVQFNPVGPEDEEQAEQETDFCNHILMQKNQGFLVLHDWFHDALLQKNGYVLVSWVKENRSQRDRFEGLTDDEFALLAKSDDAEIVEHSQSDVVSVDQMTGQMTTQTMHDAVVVARREYGCLKVANIPPERVLVAPDWAGVSLEGCPFVEVIDFKTVSELRADGHDVSDDISDLPSTDDDQFVEQARRVTQDRIEDRSDIEADAATRRLRVRYVWMQHDEDGDGLAELRRYVVVGTTVLENEEDDLIPVACCTPYRVPHEHNGMSVHDHVEDIQRIRTALVRGFLDNMYQLNNPRHAIDANAVNLDDMLVSRPGGIVRVSGSTQYAIAPLVHPQDGASILQAVEYVDGVRENRTGVTRYNQGIDANSLNKTASGITQIMTASQQRIELIARIIAETGVRTLMLIIHAMSLKHTRQGELVKLRNKWVQVDPRSWNSRYDMTVSVGLGTGNKDQMLQHLQMILLAQKEAIALGIATPKNIYNALVRLTQNAGFKLPDEFWTDPGDGPMQQPPNPEAIKAQAQGQMKQMELQAKAQSDEAQRQHELMLKQMELQQQDLQHQREQVAKLEIERIKAQAAIDSAELSAQATLSAQQTQAAQQGTQ